MSFWLFKLSDAGPYPDVLGESYVFDNTHSKQVSSGDEFLYIKKTSRTYSLTGAGRVSRVTFRPPRQDEYHNGRVERVFTAHLADVVVLARPLDLSRQTREGRLNRIRLGLPADVNTIGWSRSMLRISSDLFVRLLDAALEGNSADGAPRAGVATSWHVDDRTALVKIRQRLLVFRRAVMERHARTCAVCGTQLLEVLEVAHVRSYAADPANRANPANGVCLCCFCHAAFDAGKILVAPDGTVEMRDGDHILDEVAKKHFFGIPPAVRREWLAGVNPEFLLERCRSLRAVGSGKALPEDS